MPNRMSVWVKKQREVLLSKWGDKCSLCGSRQNLEFAHKRPTGLKGRGRGRTERVIDIRRHPSDYVLLCHSCHVWFDRQ